MQEKAKSNFEGLVRIITSLVRDKKIQVDLIVGAGNTGIAMVKLSELIFDELNIHIPPKLVIPYYRFTKAHVGEGEPFQYNNILLPEIKEKLSSIENIQNILFVDDEIGGGRTVKGVIELIFQARQELSQNKPTLYIVAEDRSYNWQGLSTLINVQYCPFAEGGPRGNAISHIVPSEIHEIIKTYGSLDPKEELNALLDLPIKDKKEDEKPIWSYDLLNDLKLKVANFHEIQSKFESYLRDLIKESTPN